MLKVNNEDVQIQGHAIEIMMNLSTLVASIREAFSKDFDKEEAEGMLKEAFAIGMRVPIGQKRIVKQTDECPEVILDALKNMLKDGEE